MVVNLGIGIDKVRFGMDQSQIESILGKPDRENMHSDDSDRLLLEYNDHNLRLTIYKDEQNRLGYLTTSNRNLTFEGKNIIGETIDYVKNEVFNNTVKIWEIDEYEFWCTYGEIEHWITLNVEFNKIIGLELGVIIDDSDEYLWPEI